MVAKFPIEHSCGAFGGRLKIYFLFRWSTGCDVTEVCDNEKSLLGKEYRLEMCRKMYWKG